MFKKIHGKFKYNTSCSDSFHIRDIMAFSDIFSIFSLAWLIKRMVQLNMCHWMLKLVFYRAVILFFVLVPRYCCFGVTYVSRSMKLHPCPKTGIGLSRCRMFQKDLLSLSACERHFLKELKDLLTIWKKIKPLY